MRYKRETLQDMTRPLKQWLYKNKNNPYPTKGQKVELAEQSKMTLTQVSNWFANARRRLKNTVRGNELSWERRVSMYNDCVKGNQESMDVSDDSAWESGDDIERDNISPRESLEEMPQDTTENPPSTSQPPPSGSTISLVSPTLNVPLATPAILTPVVAPITKPSESAAVSQMETLARHIDNTLRKELSQDLASPLSAPEPEVKMETVSQHNIKQEPVGSESGAQFVAPLITASQQTSDHKPAANLSSLNLPNPISSYSCQQPIKSEPSAPVVAPPTSETIATNISNQIAAYLMGSLAMNQLGFGQIPTPLGAAANLPTLPAVSSVSSQAPTPAPAASSVALPQLPASAAIPQVPASVRQLPSLPFLTPQMQEEARQHIALMQAHALQQLCKQQQQQGLTSPPVSHSDSQLTTHSTNQTVSSSHTSIKPSSHSDLPNFASNPVTERRFSADNAPLRHNHTENNDVIYESHELTPSPAHSESDISYPKSETPKYKNTLLQRYLQGDTDPSRIMFDPADEQRPRQTPSAASSAPTTTPLGSPNHPHLHHPSFSPLDLRKRIRHTSGSLGSQEYEDISECDASDIGSSGLTSPANRETRDQEGGNGCHGNVFDDLAKRWREVSQGVAVSKEDEEKDDLMMKEVSAIFTLANLASSRAPATQP